MKKILCILLSALMLIGLCACGGGGEEGGGDQVDPSVLQAGYCRLQCLPDDPVVHIAGGTAENDKSTDGLLDDIAVTCIAIAQGGQTYLIYTCDVVDIHNFYVTTETAITEKTGIPIENIVLNATHTHSAPTLKDNLPGKDAYLRKFNDTCAEAGEKAIADLSPATLSYGSTMTEKMVRVRHYWMNDGTSCGNGHGSASSGYKEHMYPADEECQVLRLTRAAEDKKDIVMFNLAAHATIASREQWTHYLSADFPFYARTYIEENAGVLSAYFIAAGGDATPGSKIPGEIPYTTPAAYGEKLGEYVVQCLGTMTDAQGSDVRIYGEDFYAKKKAYGAYTEGEIVDPTQCGTFPTNTMTVGDVGLVFFPGEMFGATGVRLKENSPTPMTFIVTNSEEDQGYFPTAIAEEHSFYEYDITKYATGTGDVCADRYCEILGALKDGNTPAPQATK